MGKPASSTGYPLPRGRSLVLVYQFLLEAELTPRAIVQPEGLGQLRSSDRSYRESDLLPGL